MYVFKTSQEVPTKFSKDVTVVVKKMTEDRRDELRMKMSLLIANFNLRALELESLSNRTDAESSARRGEIQTEIATVEREISNVKINWGITAIRGLAIDDEQNLATVAEWKKWPSELTEEVIAIIDRASGLVPEEIKNSQSLTTSGEAEGTRMTVTTASSANRNDSTPGETVVGISRN